VGVTVPIAPTRAVGKYYRVHFIYGAPEVVIKVSYYFLPSWRKRLNSLPFACRIVFPCLAYSPNRIARTNPCELGACNLHQGNLFFCKSPSGISNEPYFVK